MPIKHEARAQLWCKIYIYIRTLKPYDWLGVANNFTALINVYILLSLVGLLTFITQKLAARGLVTIFTARKLLHIGAVGLSGGSVYLVPDVSVLQWVVWAVVPAVVYAVYRGFFQDETGRRSWGIAWYAIIFAGLLAMYGHSKPYLVYYPMLVLALADGLAALAGRRYPVKTFMMGGDTRSVVGSLVFFISAFAALFFGRLLLPQHGVVEAIDILPALWIALFATFAEAGSSRGSDNLWVPMSVLYWLLLSECGLDSFQPGFMWLGAIVPAALLAFKLRWLSAGGALSAAIMGAFLVLSPFPEMALIPLLFFICGSMLSSLPPSEGGTPRSSIQVLANGAIPCLFLALWNITGKDEFLFAFAAGFGAALSDTASSEIGTRLGKGKTVSIIGLSPMATGLSGGISLSGTLAGIAFAALNAALFAWLFPASPLFAFLIIAFAAIFGNLTDSVVGQYLQAKYLPKNASQWQDERTEGVIHDVRGIPWIGNDEVNFLCTGVACALALLLHSLV